jgi:membrane protease YdiL (CAAX protease family)
MMDLEAAVEAAPAWQYWLYELTGEGGGNDLIQGIRWYEELAAYSDDPRVHLRLAILQGEAGWHDALRRKIEAWARQAEPFPAFAILIQSGYLGRPLDVEGEQALQADLANRLPPDWFYDRLSLSLAERAGDTVSVRKAHAALAARGDPLLRRTRALLVVELALLISGLIVLIGMVWQGRGTPGTVAAAPLPPPWQARKGMAVLITGGGIGLGLTLVFFALHLDSPWVRLSEIPVAGLPILLMAQRFLLTPVRLSLVAGFGLRPLTSGRGRVLPAVLAVLALGVLGEWALGSLAEWFDVSDHWTEWFDAELVWGGPLEVSISLVEFVVFAPPFEEMIFRGLLFATLRRRFAWPSAAILSAGLFGVAHGYGFVGLAGVCWSGMLWAWIYEKTGSLLPGILAHAGNNLLVCLTMIWLLR